MQSMLFNWRLLNRKAKRTHDNGVEKLLSLLDPIVVNAPRNKNAWKNFNYEDVVWLVRSARRHLAQSSCFGGVIYADSGQHPTLSLKQTLSSCVGQYQIIILTYPP